MNWVDIIGIGVIFPLIVGLVSYFLTRQDRRIESLHTQIIKRLLSFKHGVDVIKISTIESLSLGEALYEISHALNEKPNIRKDALREDIEYDVYGHKAEILRQLRRKVYGEQVRKYFMYGILIAIIIAYILFKVK